MKTKDLEKLTKQELLNLLNETKAKLEIAKTDSQSSKKVPPLEAKKKKIKREL